MKPSSLGDIVHTLPAAHFLKQSFPHLQLRWLCNPEWMPLLHGNEDLAEVIAFPRGEFRGLGSLPQLILWARQLNAASREMPEVTLDFQGLLRSALVCLARGTDPIIGMSDAREGAGLLYRNTVQVDRDIHAVDRYLQLVQALGVETAGRDVEFPLPEGHLPAGIPLPKDYLLLHPHSRGEGKSLSAAAIQALCDCLAPHPVVIVGRAKNAVPVAGGHVTSLVNRTTLLELIGLVRRAHACISVDSGPMHVAAALHDRTLGIHTWSDPQRVGPYNRKAKVWKAGRIAHRGEFADEVAPHPASVETSDARRIADFALREWY
ncbi:MAG: glycosyltransferase family 9 protein [Roseimicrobium sp.]